MSALRSILGRTGMDATNGEGAMSASETVEETAEEAKEGKNPRSNSDKLKPVKKRTKRRDAEEESRRDADLIGSEDAAELATGANPSLISKLPEAEGRKSIPPKEKARAKAKVKEAPKEKVPKEKDGSKGKEREAAKEKAAKGKEKAIKKEDGAKGKAKEKEATKERPKTRDGESKEFPVAAVAAAPASSASAASSSKKSLHKWGEKGDHFRKGKFSHEETRIVKRSVHMYSADHNVSVDRLCSDSKGSNMRGAWLEIADCLPHRTVQSIYRHAIRLLKRTKKGPWEREEIATLRRLVGEYGPKWSQIEQRLGRSGDSCRDKFREMGPTDEKAATSGSKWTEAEDLQLAEAVRAVSDSGEDVPLGKIPRDKISWTEVAKMIDTRTRLMCLRRFDAMTGQEDRERALKGQTSFGQVQGPDGLEDTKIPKKLRSDFSLLSMLRETNANHVSEVVWYRMPLSRSRDRWTELERDGLKAIDGFKDLSFVDQVQHMLLRNVSSIEKRGGSVVLNGEKVDYGELPDVSDDESIGELYGDGAAARKRKAAQTKPKKVGKKAKADEPFFPDMTDPNLPPNPLVSPPHSRRQKGV